LNPPPGGSAASAVARYAGLSILAAVLTMALKAEAYWLTGSVGLLSDAAESLVNLVAAVATLTLLRFSARPADPSHPFGHGKAEYFASGFEGALILVAAGGIAWAAWERLRHPQPLAELDIGVAISATAAAVNLGVARVLLRAGRRYGSIALEADGKHLMSDVWTTGAVLLALGGIAYTGWQWLDPAIAFLAALQIVWSGVGLMVRSASGLLDPAMPAEEVARIERVLGRYREEGVQFHDLRTRASGMQRFMTIHVLVPGRYTVQEGHDVLERIEVEIRAALGNIAIVTHLEPLEDAASFDHERIEAGPTGDGESEGEPLTSRRPTGGVRQAAGTGLLLLGSLGSMALPGVYTDWALGLSLIGLLLLLWGNRAAKRDRLSRTLPS
jgi:cation diffusion facilitator family transporter